MKEYCFLDSGARDFLRKDNGSVIYVDAEDKQHAIDLLSEWVMDEAVNFTNEGARAWSWDDE
tara:strand:- start:10477 stop:10662 length:186 start_codon:yes stop_codon:yes gene_type:complete